MQLVTEGAGDEIRFPDGTNDRGALRFRRDDGVEPEATNQLRRRGDARVFRRTPLGRRTSKSSRRDCMAAVAGEKLAQYRVRVQSGPQTAKLRSSDSRVPDRDDAVPGRAGSLISRGFQWGAGKDNGGARSDKSERGRRDQYRNVESCSSQWFTCQ